LRKSAAKVIHAAGGIVWRENNHQQTIAVVHRHKHQDWSLPKGKLTEEESWKEAALREVMEETGWQVEIKEYAGSISYICKGVPKVVLFWHMDAREEDPELLNGEVDKVRWLPLEEALEILDYDDEKELLLDEVRVREKGT